MREIETEGVGRKKGVIRDGFGVPVGCELVEKEPPYGFRGSAVPGEESALDDLGQPADREDRTIDVRKVAIEDCSFALGERLDVIFGGGDETRAPGRPPRRVPGPSASARSSARTLPW